MKSRIFTSVLIASTACSLLAAWQEAFTLKLDLKPNTVDKYKIDMVSNQNMNAPGAPPKIDVKASMDFTVKTGAVDDKGLADVEMAATNLKFDAGELSGMIPEDRIPKEIIQKGKLDSRYRVTELKASGASGQSQMMMSMVGAQSLLTFIELPEKPVKVGDTWTILLPKNPMYDEKDKPLTAKLVGLVDYEGTPAYEVSVEGKFDFDVDMGQVMKKMTEGLAGAAGGGGGEVPEMDMKMKGSIGITGTGMIARDSGKTLFMTTKMGAKQAMTMMGFDIAMDGTTVVNMKLAK